MRDLIEKSRFIQGKNPDSHYSPIDSQSAKTTGASEKRGIDEEKKIKGHKRHLVTDIAGHILHVKVHETNIHDTLGGCRIFKETLEKYPSLKGVCADAGYRKTMENFVQRILKKTIDISKCAVPGWAVIGKG